MKELIHDYLFARAELVRVVPVDRWEIGVGQRIVLVAYSYRSLLWVDLVEQQAVVHVVFRMALDDLAFELELDDRYCLVHSSHEHCRTLQSRVVLEVFGQELRARIVAIGVDGESGERQEIDRITLFKRLDIGIAD